MANHRTFNIANLGPKPDLLSAFWRQKCRLGFEIALILDSDQDGDKMVIGRVIWRAKSRVTLRVTLGVTLQKIE